MRSFTKELMVEALKKLSKLKPLEKITVKDIVTECQASKQTFYNHFQDKYDLFSYALVVVLEQNLMDSAKYACDFKTTILNYFRLVIQDREFYRSFMRDESAREQTFNCIARFASDYFREHIQNKLGVDGVDDEMNMSISHYTAGTAKLVVDWICSGMTRSPELMADVCFNCIPDVIKAYQ